MLSVLTPLTARWLFSRMVISKSKGTIHLALVHLLWVQLPVITNGNLPPRHCWSVLSIQQSLAVPLPSQSSAHRHPQGGGAFLLIHHDAEQPDSILLVLLGSSTAVQKPFGVSRDGRTFTNGSGETSRVDYAKRYNPSIGRRFRGYTDPQGNYHDID